MKQPNLTLTTLLLAALLLGACYPAPAPVVATEPAASAGTGQTAAQPETAAAWQTFTNPEAGFSIMAPDAWSQQTLPDQNGGAIHGMAFTGAEGGVEVYWGVGFGGACTTGTVPVRLAQVEAMACHATAADGVEMWSQIGYQVEGGSSFSVRAYTSDAEPASRDLVLQVLSKLTFMAPAQPKAGATIAAEEAAAAEARIPLKDALGTLEPRDVWQNFYDLTQIPRPSGQVAQVREFLVQFGKDLGLETIVDAAGNVIIRKPAAEDKEGIESVTLQGHMDMVPQKNADTVHDFATDPIDAYVDGEWVVADGTTLGADNGIGMALAMAVLQAQAPLGPIEALFTADEETTMSGALGLEPGVLQGATLINGDSEVEGEFIIGSAGGETARIAAPYDEVEAPAGMAAYVLSVTGLQGGHSGLDINRGRGHAIKLLVRFLKENSGMAGIRVAQMAGGSAPNAIPREATALVVIPPAQTDAFLAGVREFEKVARSELAATEPDLSVQATPSGETPAKVMDEQEQQTLLDALDATPQGVIRMSDAVPGLVQTSSNMGIVAAQDGQLTAACAIRSSVDAELDAVGQAIREVWEPIGIDVEFSGRYSGWNPNPNSPILLLMQDVYQELYGKEAAVSAVHAGLECGTIVAKYPGMDAISIGPTLQNVHSPNERLQVASVKKLYEFLLETLARMPAAGAGAALTTPPATQADPLPSWNPGPAKESILKFVAEVTDPANSSYVPPAERIAVTDNDGTLWTEKPMPAQGLFVFASIAAMAPDHPEWKTTQPYQAVLEGDREALESLGMEDIEKLLFTTHAGMTEEEFEATAKAFLDTAKHPRFGVPFTQTVYQPMLELLALLRANDFKTFIVSGGGVEFMRVFSEEVYGIPREDVIGSSLQYKFQLTPEGAVLVRQPELVSFDDREMKPANIQLHIGRRPIMAIGNSDGDLAMFQYTASRQGPYLNLLVVHDDAEREYEVLTGTDAIMAAAAQSPWVFASMKRDFKTVFPEPH